MGVYEGDQGPVGSESWVACWQEGCYGNGYGGALELDMCYGYGIMLKEIKVLDVLFRG